jgi:hypothetical protein
LRRQLLIGSVHTPHWRPFTSEGAVHPARASRWGALVVVGLLAGCGEGGSSSGGPGGGQAGTGGGPGGCSTELCAPYTCDHRFEACFTTCESSECIDGHVCEQGVCIGTECTEETAQTRCGAYACVKGECAHDCVAGPCADGFYCRGDTNECVPRCTSIDDPVCSGYLCDLEVGECEPYCLDGELGCATGYVCTDDYECAAETP